MKDRLICQKEKRNKNKKWWQFWKDDYVYVTHYLVVKDGFVCIGQPVKKEIICKKCGDKMKFLGNVSGIIYTTYPEQWDDVYVCDKCKTQETIRERGQIYDPTEGRDLGEYTTIKAAEGISDDE